MNVSGCRHHAFTQAIVHQRIGDDVVLTPHGPDAKRAVASELERGVREIGARRVLLAEDHPVNQLLLTRLLESEGLEVVQAQNGAEALSQVGEADFDLVLMDLRMPVLDGFEAARRIREQELRTGGHVPIVGMTVEPDADHAARCRDIGMDGFLAKPIDRERLLSELRRHLASRQRVRVPTAVPV